MSLTFCDREPDLARDTTLANWRMAPHSRWAFTHVDRLIATAPIANDPQQVAPMPRALEPLDALTVRISVDEALSLRDVLTRTATTAIVVLKDGQLVYEAYADALTERRPHILMSVSKSIVGIVAGILEAQDALRSDDLVTRYVPEIGGTAYRAVTIRHLLDMTAGVAFDEDYAARVGPIKAYRKAMNWDPVPEGEPTSGLHAFYDEMTDRSGPHGARFHYVSPNTDLLGWVIERASGQSFAEVMSEQLWRPMGAEAPAVITVDRLGAPRCAGGICARARDLARLGQMLLDVEREPARHVVPQSWLADTRSNGCSEAWAKNDFSNYFPTSDLSYRNGWYVRKGASPLMFALGIHGQHLFVDHGASLVVAKLSAQALPLDQAAFAATWNMLDAIRTHLAFKVGS